MLKPKLTFHFVFIFVVLEARRIRGGLSHLLAFSVPYVLRLVGICVPEIMYIVMYYAEIMYKYKVNVKS